MNLFSLRKRSLTWDLVALGCLMGDVPEKMELTFFFGALSGRKMGNRYK